jgi:hypothetical protein
LAADQGAAPSAIGDWKAVFVGPIGPRPKMVDAIHFSIRDTPLGPVATAKAANWPGMLDVTDLKIDGDRVSFTGTGRAGWSVRPAGGPTEHFCCPKLLFAGTVRGDEMTLSLTWQRSDLPDDPRKQPLPMEAARVR